MQYDAGFVIRNNGADRHAQRDVVSAGTVAFGTHAILAVTCQKLTGVAVFDERVDVAVGDRPDAAALAAIGAPLPQVTFCPTGGITLAKAPDYLKLANVACCGGSWVAPKGLMQAGDWAGIERLAAEAAALPR